MTQKSNVGSMPAAADADTQDGFSNDSPSAGKPNTAVKSIATQKQGKRPTPSPATEKISGAGPAVAEHSMDAKAPKSGRQASAYVKE